MDKILVRSPDTVLEWDAYYNLRWRVLREPWHQPIGSEKDDLENYSIHAMAIDSDVILGTARLNFLDNNVAQIRFMAVNIIVQSKGVGSLLLQYLETKAIENGISKIILQSRENAVKFYLKNGYTLKEKTFLLWNQIQHYLMEKSL